MLVPERAARLLGRMSEWIMANGRMLEIAFGALFLRKGLTVLA